MKTKHTSRLSPIVVPHDAVVVFLDTRGRKRWETTGARAMRGIEDTLQVDGQANAHLIAAAKAVVVFWHSGTPVNAGCLADLSDAIVKAEPK